MFTMPKYKIIKLNADGTKSVVFTDLSWTRANKLHKQETRKTAFIHVIEKQ